ncbi:glycosyltransferase family 2 protein [Kiritimatiella glycovorans]|uniref:Glycosyltransferase 2-like domain-containing protein n=1 Tax=Kiritimatiella glycovorans TaxID=1307763 RepID=A0A0G3EEX9_9BACT|nr:glycosyltransferase family 2 protein [Kiritimatiella glycovorans]AKJ65031.1 hypothetical protein L21SP4_01794 [Kiritimatiella glycovorans]
MADQNKTVALVVPFLNERENLRTLYERTIRVFESEPEEVRFIFVDDGSTDDGPDVLLELREKDPRVGLLRLSRNFGHQVAITAGMDHADADAVVIIDADLQDPPEVIPDLLRRWREGCEVVYAVRRRRAGESWLKRTLAAGFYKLFRRLARVDVPLNAGDFRLLDRRAVESLRGVREQHRFMRGLTCWIGFTQGSVEYDREARHDGETKYPVWKSLHLAFDAITSFSSAPLRLISWLGIITCILGVLWLLRIVIIKWVDPAAMVPGWTSLMAAVLLLGGAQLFAIGMLGQYVSRIYEEVKKRPLYLLSRKEL